MEWFFLTKAERPHKYLSRKPDGKGGWVYQYASKKKEKASAYPIDERAVREQIKRLNGDEDTYELRRIPINEIDVPPVWAESKIAPLRVALREGKHLPPIRADRGPNGNYAIDDGIHRANAAREAGYTHVPAIVPKAAPLSKAMLFKARKLHRRREWNGMLISVENQAGSYRHWRNSHDGTSGSTKMLYDYGYIRRTEGTDGEHVDVYVGPNKDAPFVYVVTTMKAPHFLDIDEQKCMLGFNSQHDAREAFHAHFNDRRFMGEIRSVPLVDFRAYVLDPKNHGKLIKGYVMQRRPRAVAPLPDVQSIYGISPAAPTEQEATERRRRQAAKKNSGRLGFHGKPKLPTKRFRIRDWPNRPTTR